jgi:hypothetical protein
MTMGIATCRTDLGYPFPLRQYRNGAQIKDVADSEVAIVNSNDQHCYLRYPAGADIKIGDLFAFGISHPCTAFDKWTSSTRRRAVQRDRRGEDVLLAREAGHGAGDARGGPRPGRRRVRWRRHAPACPQ